MSVSPVSRPSHNAYAEHRRAQLGRVVAFLDEIIPTLDPDDAWRETLEIVRYNVERGSSPRNGAATRVKRFAISSSEASGPSL